MKIYLKKKSRTRHPSLSFLFLVTETWKHPSPSVNPVTQCGSRGAPLLCFLLSWSAGSGSFLSFKEEKNLSCSMVVFISLCPIIAMLVFSLFSFNRFMGLRPKRSILLILLLLSWILTNMARTHASPLYCLYIFLLSNPCYCKDL